MHILCSLLSMWNSQLYKSSPFAYICVCLVHFHFRDFNLYGGCTVGTGGGGDCPWYKSTTGEEYCVSSADFAGIHALSATPTECCHRHFKHVDTATCVMNSLADIAAVQAKDMYDLQRTKYYYPDLHGRRNCVYDSDYQDWMDGAVSFVVVPYTLVDLFVTTCIPPHNSIDII